MATNIFTAATAMGRVGLAIGGPVGLAVGVGVGVVAATVIISMKKTKPIQKPHG